MSWTRDQKNVTIAAYLGWTLDAFDFFLTVFVLKDIAAEFNVKIPAVAFAITLTLAMRPLGALIFGRLADKYGRRPTLMLNIACYSLLELLSGFSPNLATFITLRALFGIAMGGEWGVGGALTMETIPPKSRGIVSGLLQAGYPSGYLLASIVFGVLFQYIGWRGMFFVGVLPALLVLYVRSHVPESPAWKAMEKRTRPSLLTTLKHNLNLSIYAIVLMTAFNFFSHGTQDLYPTFLREQHHFDPHTVSLITIVLNIGAMAGGLFFGAMSERIGRRRAIFIAALIALPVLPLWAFSTGPVLLALGAFLMQISVQGAWGVIPVHLNEISPDEIRATFPGLVYQLGNLFASVNATLQASLAESRGGDYASAMAIVAGTVAVVIAVLILFSRERRGIDMTQSAKQVASNA
ncbi:MFS transporter [Paraburkholderia caballeronis]|uniref:MFS transporter, SHS family, lactate transporter n=1 Tax=Paraburkholderia caballeronis TaxID=416943 RepID=A0A1H7K3G0_9BURK|nr:MFS transporter [Paraburkholderia caballeronis]PXW27176.1 SHS family lactate transporter-like MFS transporter [Paraburkholderia caballeronis]PXX02650.1 SHS family lactate transporter-like MFS transporter [Paraburkholderia caballeronis]RAK03375.1 SHS family lactate transporter-like MFS transporter [Paraburkholderia caballeronis]TDV11567.1 SHS family lactate transporter-like MFS transporter [Paraburkholderia caballeronis]TDV17426.1 SHS family lactate transporter-like MFS transporter [Paraburk